MNLQRHQGQPLGGTDTAEGEIVDLENLDEETKRAITSLFKPEEGRPPNGETTLPTITETSAPVIDSQAKTPEPLTNEEANRALASTTNGWLGALFHDNPQIYL